MAAQRFPSCADVDVAVSHLPLHALLFFVVAMTSESIPLNANAVTDLQRQRSRVSAGVEGMRRVPAPIAGQQDTHGMHPTDFEALHSYLDSAQVCDLARLHDPFPDALRRQRTSQPLIHTQYLPPSSLHKSKRLFRIQCCHRRRCELEDSLARSPLFPCSPLHAPRARLRAHICISNSDIAKTLDICASPTTFGGLAERWRFSHMLCWFGQPVLSPSTRTVLIPHRHRQPLSLEELGAIGGDACLRAPSSEAYMRTFTPYAASEPPRKGPTLAPAWESPRSNGLRLFLGPPQTSYYSSYVHLASLIVISYR